MTSASAARAVVPNRLVINPFIQTCEDLPILLSGDNLASLRSQFAAQNSVLQETAGLPAKIRDALRFKKKARYFRIYQFPDAPYATSQNRFSQRHRFQW